SGNTSGNLLDASGNAIAGFSDLNVAIDSPTTMSSMYNPSGGYGSNYGSTGYQMVLNFSTPLNTNIVPNAADFTVNGNTVNAVQVQPYGVILSLANAPASNNPQVTYTPSSSNGLQDVLGNPIAGFSVNSGVAVTEASSTTIFLSAFNQKLNTGYTPSASQFKVTLTDVDGNSIGTLTVNNVLVKSNGVQLTISGKIDPNSTDVNVSYTSNGTLQYSNGTTIDSFQASSLVAGIAPTTIGSQSVISNIEAALGSASSPTMAPNTGQGNTLLAWVNDAPPITPIAAILSQGSNSSTATITLDFAGVLTNTTNIPFASQFTISDQNGNSYSVNNVQITNDSVELTLDQPVTQTTQLNIGYKLSSNSNSQNLTLSSPTNPTLYVDNFSNFAITNTIGNTSAPIVLGAASIATSSNTNLITLVFNQLISGFPLVSQFTVLVNGVSYTINEANAAEANNTVTLSVTGNNLIAPGDVVTVSYNSNGNPLNGINGPVASFTNQPVITAASTPTTVIQAGFGTVGNGGYSFSGISSIPGTDGFNFTPAAAQDQLSSNDVVVWSHATSQDIPTNLLPGQFYTSNQTSIINNSLSQASIQYSIYNPHTQQWTIASGIPDMPFGANSKPTLGSGPNGNLMAVWLNNNSQAIVNGDYQLELQTSGEYSGQLTLVNNTDNTVV
ncbi:MAG: SwmB domain-containing protein, partial [Nostocales cyanobacterium ELA608]